MTEVRWDGGANYEMVLDASCDASPAAVYDVLADLSTHLDWAGDAAAPWVPAPLGARHRAAGARDRVRPASVRSPWPGPGGRTTTRSSRRGARRSWSSTRKPSRCGGAASGPKRCTSTGTRSSPSGTGSHVTYRLRQTAIENPPRRMRLPMMRTMTHRVMIPWFCKRGFKNLLRSAERRGAMSEVVQT